MERCFQWRSKKQAKPRLSRSEARKAPSDGAEQFRSCGRYLVRFPDLPEALTDGVDEDEALAEAADCLSEALASRIVDGEEIPSPSPERDRYLVSPDPTIALKAALYTALRRRDMTIADLAG
jgi:predicted RNase H-like HicB family nuclease